ncbi:MAG: NifB/NifX family molybdenum-iron cluster-binding protein [Anaerolineae bacterium]|nr:NifB/NifX family molybdenum-iron cluster-binding protein [Anaerolineae bacterium]
MRIAVSADDRNGLDSVVSPHFGRCPYFIIVDVEGNQIVQVQEVENPFYASHAPGQVPRFIHQQGVDVMLTGGMGGRAIQFFEQFGVRPVTGAAGTVRLALERFLGGQLQGVEPCAESRAHGHGVVPPEGEYERDDLGRLKEEVEALQSQLQEVALRLKNLLDRG